MKKMYLIVASVLLVAVASACNPSDGQEIIATERVVAGEEATPGGFELPESFQLMLGVFALEETEFAVTLDQASEMLTLWKAFRSLSTSDTVAAAELEAVVGQIQATFTREQTEAIAAMELTQENIFEVAQDLGVIPEGGFPRGEGEGFPEGGFPEGGFQGVGGFPGGGGGPGGGGFPGGGGPGGGGNLDPEAIATLRAERSGISGFGNRAGGFLLDPLIELLEIRAAGAE